MARVVARSVVDGDGLARILAPRSDLLQEAACDDPGDLLTDDFRADDFRADAVQADDFTTQAGVRRFHFKAASGPLSSYHRQVDVVEFGTTADSDARFEITQAVDFRFAIPYFAWLFVLPFRRAIVGPVRAKPPWWAPPEHLDARASACLGTLGVMSVVFGYLNTLFTQTIPFAGEQFTAANTAQGVAGSVVRVGGVLALVVVAQADRRGRRVVLLASAAVGCALAATGALAPSLAWLTASQMLARAFATAMAILVTIIAAEEVPAGCRAYAVSLLAIAAGLGAGVCVLALRLADLGPNGWRFLYLIPLLGLPFVVSARRRLVESRRFVAPHPHVDVSGHGGRLLLLAASGLLLNVFIAPQSQFGNRFLRSERGFSGGKIGLFSVIVGTPAVIGIVAGGRLADIRGRRLVAAVSLVGGTVATVVFFYTTGWGVWLTAVVGNVVAAASVPALGVYGPELFPTGLRGRANGVVAVASLAGSAIGLVVAGVLSDRFGSIGPAMSILAVGPVVLAGLVLAAYPETAHRELEDLNPEDRT